MVLPFSGNSRLLHVAGILENHTNIETSILDKTRFYQCNTRQGTRRGHFPPLISFNFDSNRLTSCTQAFSCLNDTMTHLVYLGKVLFSIHRRRMFQAQDHNHASVDVTSSRMHFKRQSYHYLPYASYKKKKKIKLSRHSQMTSFKLFHPKTCIS